MDYNKLEYYLSQPRLNRFLIAVDNSKIKAQKLYRANLRVAQSFYPILNLFEIVLRNTINYQLSAYFANPNWIINEKNGFMADDSLHRSHYYLKNAVSKAERNIRDGHGVVTAGKIIAEQSFGFWTSLYETHHYRLIGGSVIHVFGRKPSDVNRNIINQKLKEIREFRNRIYHNEPVCFNGNTLNFTYAESVKNTIYELLSWIDDDLINYVKYFDAISEKIQVGMNI